MRRILRGAQVPPCVRADVERAVSGASPPGGMGTGMSDSKLPDNQTGFEKGPTLGLAALCCKWWETGVRRAQR